MRPDERGAVPDLLVGGLGEPAGEGVPRRLAGRAPGRSSRSARPGWPRPPRRARSRRAPRRAARRGAPAGAAGPRRSAPPASRKVAVPEAQLVARGASPRGSRAGARSAAGGSGRRSRASSRSPGVVALASWSSAARRSPGEPATRSISSGAKTTTRSGPSSERRSAADAVDPDPLAPGAAVGAGPDDRDLDGVGAETPLDPREVAFPSGSARRRPWSGASGPRPGARSPRGGWSCRPRSGPRSSCGPGPKAASRAAYPRRSSRLIESSRVAAVRSCRSALRSSAMRSSGRA